MKNKLILFGLVAGVLTAWLITPIVVTNLHSELAARGQFGDLYGSVNSLFSGLAFAGLFYTVFIQSQQLSLQRDELKLQREELKLQRDEMAGSRTALNDQVRMQQALIKATIAQIVVAANNAAIEAIKMDSEQRVAGRREEFVQLINIRAESLRSLADKLELAIPTLDGQNGDG